MTIKFLKGDLLRQEVDAIVNTVNCVGVMGKGIALQFKQKWPDNFRAYQAACKAEQVVPGKMFIFDSGGLVKPNFIVNFPTKRHWREKTRLSYIDAGLTDLVSQVKRLNIRSIALPPLGCGNGGLDWATVRPRIEAAFAQLPDVDVRLFAPDGAPDPQDMVINTKQPRMTPGRAAVVKVIAIYREMGYMLSRLEIQKLAYFLEFAGQQLNLRFTKNKYGPYSDVLRHVLEAMDGHYITGVGDHVSEAQIRIQPEALREADIFVEAAKDRALLDNVERVAQLIDGFETPFGMELLATVHWVAANDRSIDTVNAAVIAVQSWNDRKKSLFTEQHVRLAWDRLTQGGWIDRPGH